MIIANHLRSFWSYWSKNEPFSVTAAPRVNNYLGTTHWTKPRARCPSEERSENRVITLKVAVGFVMCGCRSVRSRMVDAPRPFVCTRNGLSIAALCVLEDKGKGFFMESGWTRSRRRGGTGWGDLTALLLACTMNQIMFKGQIRTLLLQRLQMMLQKNLAHSFSFRPFRPWHS